MLCLKWTGVASDLGSETRAYIDNLPCVNDNQKGSRDPSSLILHRSSILGELTPRTDGLSLSIHSPELCSVFHPRRNFLPRSFRIMSHTTSLLRWLQRKRYQYEVTFSLYMLTSTEKFIFSMLTTSANSNSCSSPVITCDGVSRCTRLTLSADSFLFLFISMVIIAASLYLPEHIVNMWNRAWFYYAGDDAAVAAGKPAAFGLDGGGVPMGVDHGDNGLRR